MNREEVLDWLYRIKSKLTMYFPVKWVSECEQAIDYAIKALENQKTGHWKRTIHYARPYRVCSVCGCERINDHSTGWNYCPNCGAKMEGNKE